MARLVLEISLGVLILSMASYLRWGRSSSLLWQLRQSWGYFWSQENH